jgi:hypothetical protein
MCRAKTEREAMNRREALKGILEERIKGKPDLVYERT